MKRILSLFVENKHGVLARISELFSGKGYNLESLTVGVTTDTTVSRITLVCNCEDVEIEQVKKQLNRLIDVIKLIDLTGAAIVAKELAFIKLGVTRGQREEIFKLCDVFGCKMISLSTDSLMLELCDSSEKIDNLVDVLTPYSILEIARSGLVAMEDCKKRN